MTAPFHDRRHAGRLLAERVRAERTEDILVLALPRGGVPVARAVAEALDAPLDVFVVRKLGAPRNPEVAIGAIASGGIRVLNHPAIKALRIPPEWVEAIDAREMRELERRERLYRGDRPPPDLTGRTVVLVDDGLATGATMLAAVRAARRDEPRRIVVAVPVASPTVIDMLREEADEVVCVIAPSSFGAVGALYEDFSQVSDDEVRGILERARRPPQPGAPELLRHLTGDTTDYDSIIERARGARCVLLGEASHGTHEFYRERAEITKRLVAEAGYGAVAVEADWPDAHRVNRYVHGSSKDVDAEEALSDFRRFPTWMWRNSVVAEFVEWLHRHNQGRSADDDAVGFYGLDLYSMHRSMEAVVEYLEEADPEAAERARERYSCFDQFGRDPQVYAYEAGIAGALPCEEQAVDVLVELQSRAAEEDDSVFYAEQNARLVVDAEEYYRAMFRGGVESWNLRDRHMAGTLDAVIGHLERRRGPVKVVVWAHNSHLGDARATELGQAGELNVGQLVRERLGAEALLVGFSTHAGAVTAASDWGGPAERKRVRPALPGSWEELFHRMDVGNVLLGTGGTEGRRLERAIGVVYRPETERLSHYFHARIAEQFDAVIHIDETTALEPLERTAEWEAAEVPETYPWGV
jgi:erythromycin esterase-like protein/predicted phosphoribosyltransferase